MSIPVRVLLVEDSEDDTLLIVEKLREGGYDPQYERVETRDQMLAALDRQEWDLILADYKLPGFTGLEALEISCRRIDVCPFIIISGAISEEAAVQAMRSGARDYVFKDNLARLLPAVERELRDAEVRREKDRLAAAISESNARYRALFENSRDIILFVRPDGSIVEANQAAVDTYGYSREELVSMNVLDLRRAGSRELVVRQMSRAEREGISFETVHYRKDGSRLDVEVNSVGVSIHGEPLLLSIVRDVTERKRAVVALDAERRRLRAVLDALPVGVFIADASGRMVEYNDQVKAIWGKDAPKLDSVDQYGQYKGWWADTGEPLQARDWGLARALLTGQTSVGELLHIETFDGERRTILNSAAPIVSSTGSIVGGVAAVQDVTELVRLREEVEREGRRWAALEGVSEAGLSRLDARGMLDLMVRRIAEGMRAHSGHLLVLDEEKNEFVAEATFNVSGVQSRRRLAQDGFIGKINREQKTVYVADAQTDPLVTDTSLKKQGIHTLLGTPMVARGQLIGIVYVNYHEVREIGPEDRRLFESMARRAAAALENARLYDSLMRSRDEIERVLEREQRFSLLLQRALLPAVPVVGPGYDVAVEYIPAYASREIGGDFYDVFRSTNGWVGILIGDVAGKGLEAASLAAATRSTVHAFVHETSSPGEVLGRANNVLTARPASDEQFVTVSLAVLDTHSGEVTYSAAGHPPAAVLRSDGRVELLPPGGLALGLTEDFAFTEISLRLEPGDSLVLYTDGISEARRGMDLFETGGIERALQGHGNWTAQQVVDHLVSAAQDWAEGKLRDDAAVVVVKRV